MAALLLTALIHVVPASALFRPQAMQQLYGSASMTPEMALLLRHRAAGFATLTVMACVGTVVGQWRTPVLLFALGSVASFVVLWLRSGVRTAALDRVAYVDIALIPVLVAGLALS